MARVAFRGDNGAIEETFERSCFPLPLPPLDDLLLTPEPSLLLLDIAFRSAAATGKLHFDFLLLSLKLLPSTPSLDMRMVFDANHRSINCSIFVRDSLRFSFMDPDYCQKNT